MASGFFVLWMLPWIGFALVALYIGYLAYEAAKAREQARLAPPPGPDPVIELTRINTEISRLATQARRTLETTRDAMQRGLRG